jgi:hypothetical protein
MRIHIQLFTLMRIRISFPKNTDSCGSATHRRFTHNCGTCYFLTNDYLSRRGESAAHGGTRPRSTRHQHGRCLPMDLLAVKTPNPKCRLYWCLIEFIDWRYSQSCWYFRPSFVNYSIAPLTLSLVSSHLPVPV